MTKFVISFLIVVAILVGGWVVLFLRSRHLPMPPQDVLDRVTKREREIQARERLERED
jgi:hypothetical protein